MVNTGAGASDAEELLLVLPGVDVGVVEGVGLEGAGVDGVTVLGSFKT